MRSGARDGGGGGARTTHRLAAPPRRGKLHHGVRSGGSPARPRKSVAHPWTARRTVSNDEKAMVRPPSVAWRRRLPCCAACCRACSARSWTRGDGSPSASPSSSASSWRPSPRPGIGRRGVDPPTRPRRPASCSASGRRRERENPLWHFRHRGFRGQAHPRVLVRPAGVYSTAVGTTRTTVGLCSGLPASSGIAGPSGEVAGGCCVDSTVGASWVHAPTSSPSILRGSSNSSMLVISSLTSSRTLPMRAITGSRALLGWFVARRSLRRSRRAAVRSVT
jgi:hypothetical protein